MKNNCLELSAVAWFEVEKQLGILNSLLLFFDKIYIPNTLWLETGSKFEDIFFKFSLDKKEIYDVVLSPIFLGHTPNQNAISFSKVYGSLPIIKKDKEGILIPYFDTLKNIDKYPCELKQILHDIFAKVNKHGPFRKYNEFTYDYVNLIYNSLFFIGKKETRGNENSNWFDNFQAYIKKCLDVQKNIPVVTNIESIFTIERYIKHPSPPLKYNPDILISALLLSLSKVHINNFITKDPRIILDLKSAMRKERKAFLNKIQEHSISLHKMLDNKASFSDLLHEAAFVVKAEILPQYKIFKARCEKETKKSIFKKFITFTDCAINFGLSAFTLNYSETKKSLKGLHNIIKGKALNKQLCKANEKYSNYFYLLRIEDNKT